MYTSHWLTSSEDCLTSVRTFSLNLITTANIENDDDGDNDDGDNDASFQEISNAKKQQENDESKAE